MSHALTRRSDLRLGEIFGLLPAGARLREARLAFTGEPGTPRSRFGVSSLRMLQPRQGVTTWLGRQRADGKVPIANLFNHTPTPVQDGWSVAVTKVRDFRGGEGTYDSHNGTDFVVPVGTPVVAAAPGRVLRVSSEFNRGGLKVLVDHGRGLVTSYNHLARALVAPGDLVARGAALALSGYSGLDGFLTFPWVAPHVHFNVWLCGVHVDPFAVDGEEPLWRGEGNEPNRDDGTGGDAAYEPADWAPTAVDEAATSCLHAPTRAAILAGPTFEQRAVNALFFASYFPTRFEAPPHLYRRQHERTRWLDLPFGRPFDGALLPPARRLGVPFAEWLRR